MKKILILALTFFAFTVKANASQCGGNPSFNTWDSKWYLMCDMGRSYYNEYQTGYNYYYTELERSFWAYSYLYGMESGSYGTVTVNIDYNGQISNAFTHSHTYGPYSSDLSSSFGGGYAPAGSTIKIDAELYKTAIQFDLRWN